MISGLGQKGVKQLVVVYNHEKLCWTLVAAIADSYILGPQTSINRGLIRPCLWPPSPSFHVLSVISFWASGLVPISPKNKKFIWSRLVLLVLGKLPRGLKYGFIVPSDIVTWLRRGTPSCRELIYSSVWSGGAFNPSLGVSGDDLRDLK